MIRIGARRRIPIILAVMANLVLLISVVFLMSYVQRLLYSDVKINLTEVVTQNKDVITSKLMLEVNQLEMVSGQLSDQLKGLEAVGEEQLRTVAEAYIQDHLEEGIFVSDAQGRTYMPGGTTLDVAGRRYFRIAMQGMRNISDRLTSRLDGEEIFVISVPLYDGERVVGTVQKPYSPESMYELCSISLYSDKGYMHIINSEGYILITSQNVAYSQESENFFRNTYAQGNQQASRQLEEDIQAGRAGFMEMQFNGQKIFSAYTPIEALHDWYLISSVATEAVSLNANTVIRMFYTILMMVVFLAGISFCSFQAYKRRQRLVLEAIAFRDEITGGNTYNKFLVELSGALQERPEQQYWLMAFDIDNFKYVNSFYGFDLGDRLLRQIYRDVSGRLMAGETLARISGDHFVALLTDGAEERLDRLLERLITVEGVAVYLSAGIYAIGDMSESVNLMVDKASTAAQAAKGRLDHKIVAYSVQFEQSIIQNEQLKRQIDGALANREIIPFFQPKVDVNTGVLVGAEALARWRTADGKMISPGEFIPICEKTGQITDLDMSIFEQTLDFLAKNLAQGVKCVPISVNFSRIHLMWQEFVHNIMERLEAYQVPAEYIQIEITESVIFDNQQVIIDFANHLHEHGLLLCIDDFGSGYSSLNMLKDLPIDVLKIDKGFLDETKNPDRQRIILSSIAQMAERLGLEVVVEGVETAENVALMREFGCAIAQGFYFARPMTIEAFEEVVRRGRV